MVQAASSKTIATISEVPLIGSVFTLRKDVLAFLNRVVTECGNVGQYHLGPITGIVFNTPETVHEVLVAQEDAFDKGSLTLNGYHSIDHNPVLINEGQRHAEERAILDQAFAHEHIEAFSNTVSNYTEEAQKGWQEGATIDVQPAMQALTLRIIGKVLFDRENLDESDDLAAALLDTPKYLAHAVKSPVVFPLSLPILGNKKVRTEITLIEQRLQAAIAERRTGGKTDLLAMMVKARDAQDAALSDTQLKDDVIEIFNAACENVGVGLAWAMYLLATHPEIAAKARHEVDDALVGRTPTYADIAHLPYITQIVKESLRLYPPIFVLLPRRALRDVEIAGYHVRKGTLVLISPYLMHHHPDIYPHPDRFNPERFAPEKEGELPKQAFMPFGGGSHNCLGFYFAMMEMRLVLATLLQRITFSLAPGQIITPHATFVLNQANGCKIVIERRK